jgi:hypothetical protein
VKQQVTSSPVDTVKPAHAAASAEAAADVRQVLLPPLLLLQVML